MDADKLLTDTETVYEQTADYLRDGSRLFHENEGELFTQNEAKNLLTDELDISADTARQVLDQLVVDSVDPVIQLSNDGTRYVGVAEFHTFDGGYGYVDHDATYGKQRRAVCQQCVDESAVDTDVVAVSDTDLAGLSTDEVSWDDLVESIHEHYAEAHSVLPNSTESSAAATGAELRESTTIGGNKPIHKGLTPPIGIEVENSVKVGGRSPDGKGGVARDEQLYTDTNVLAVLDQNTDLQLVDSSLVSGTSVSDDSVDAQIQAADSQHLQGQQPASHGNDIATTNEVRTDSEIQAAVEGSNAQYTDEQAQDAINQLLSGGDKLTTTYDDGNNTLTIDTTALDEEGVEDTVNTLLAGGDGINTTYNDTTNSLTLAVSEGDIALGNLTGDTDSVPEGSANVYFTDERARDAVGSIVGGGLNYNDSSDLIEILAGNALEIDTFGEIGVVEGNISHDSIADVSPGDHHSKTSSASELSDVSADSASGAHHSKTSSASELSDVSADSASGAHHSKTSSASELSDVSADSASGAHHSKYTDENAQDAVGNNVGTNLSYDDTGGAISLADDTVTVAGQSVALGGSTSLSLGSLTGNTDDVSEGGNQYFTTERAQDAVGTILGGNLSYSDNDGLVDSALISIDQGPSSSLDADTVDGVEAADLGSDVSNDGTTVTNSSTDLDFTGNLQAVDDGDGTSTINLTQGSNSGLNADTVDGVEAADLGGGDLTVSSGGTTVTNPSTALDFTGNLEAVDDGDGTSTINLTQGSGSGLNADTVDGKDAADLGGGREIQKNGSDGNGIINFKTQ